jgi:hypothetical protein
MIDWELRDWAARTVTALDSNRIKPQAVYSMYPRSY